MTLISRLTTGYTVLLFIVGVALLFAPGEIAGAVQQAAPQDPIFAPLLGAAFLGFGAANWIARRAPLGGIYGRALVAGNQALSFIGTLVLVRSLSTENGPGYWLLLVLFLYGALLYSWLLFRGPRRQQ